MYHNLRMFIKHPLMLVAALLIGWGSLPLSAQNATVSG